MNHTVGNESCAFTRFSLVLSKTLVKFMTLVLRAVRAAAWACECKALEEAGESDETRGDLSPDSTVCAVQCPAAAAAAAAVVQPRDKNVLRNCEKPFGSTLSSDFGTAWNYSGGHN